MRPFATLALLLSLLSPATPDLTATTTPISLPGARSADATAGSLAYSAALGYVFASLPANSSVVVVDVFSRAVVETPPLVFTGARGLAISDTLGALFVAAWTSGVICVNTTDFSTRWVYNESLVHPYALALDDDGGMLYVAFSAGVAALSISDVTVATRMPPLTGFATMVSRALLFGGGFLFSVQAPRTVEVYDTALSTSNATWSIGTGASGPTDAFLASDYARLLVATTGDGAAAAPALVLVDTDTGFVVASAGLDAKCRSFAGIALHVNATTIYVACGGNAVAGGNVSAFAWGDGDALSLVGSWATPANASRALYVGDIDALVVLSPATAGASATLTVLAFSATEQAADPTPDPTPKVVVRPSRTASPTPGFGKSAAGSTTSLSGLALSPGAIAGVVAGGVVLCIVVPFAALVFCGPRKRRPLSLAETPAGAGVLTTMNPMHAAGP